MAKYISTIKNTATGWQHTSEHATRRAAAQTAAMALKDNSPRMTKAEANKAFGAMLDASTAMASATYGDYRATVDKL